MRTLLFIGFVLVFASFVSAAGPIDWDSFSCVNAMYDGRPIEEAQIALPQELVSFTEGEKILMRVPNMPPASGEVKDGILQNIRCEDSYTKTMTIQISRDAIQKIAESNYPLQTFKELKEEGKIDVTGHTIIAAVKVFFLSVALFFA